MRMWARRRVAEAREDGERASMRGGAAGGSSWRRTVRGWVPRRGSLLLLRVGRAAEVDERELVRVR